MTLSFKISTEKGWVFSPLVDICCFTLPFLAAFFFDDNYFNQSSLGLFLTKILFAGHIFVTPIPLAKAMGDARANKWKFFIIPALYVVVYLVLIYYDFIYFKSFLCFTILVHNFFQHLSWGRISLAGNKYLLQYSKVLIILPLALWFLNQLPSVPHYLYRFTLTEHLPKLNLSRELMMLTIFFFSVSFLASFSYEREKKTISLNLGRLHYFMTTTLWLTYGLFYTQTVAFFLYYINISHGFGYLIYISRSWPSHSHIPKWEAPNKIIKLTLTSIVGGTLWMTALWGSHRFLTTPFIYMAWFPLIMHFAFDSYLWSKKRLSAVQV